MRSDQHRPTISPRPSHGFALNPTSPIRTLAALGSPSPVRRYPSTGAATFRRPLSSRGAAPVLIDSAPAPAGEDDRANARNVLFIHGPSASSLIWTRVLSLLSEGGVHTHVVRYGGERQAGPDAVDQFANAAALARLLDEQHSAPAVIVGYGAGSGLALALAATAPRHVRALVLVAPVAEPLTIGVIDRVLATPLLGASLAWIGFRGAGLAVRIGPLRDVIAQESSGFEQPRYRAARPTPDRRTDLAALRHHTTAPGCLRPMLAARAEPAELPDLHRFQ